jgi:antitoxin CptB
MKAIGVDGDPPSGETAVHPAAAAVRGPLRWRCRRGMKELDVLLERFARRALAQASPADCQVYAQVLELPDPLLAGYLLGGETPAEPHLAQAIARMRALCRLDDGSAVFCR